jgi:hypothetical protein
VLILFFVVHSKSIVVLAVEEVAVELSDDEDGLDGFCVDADEELGEGVGGEGYDCEDQDTVGGVVLVERNVLDQGVGDEDVCDGDGEGHESVQNLGKGYSTR